MCRPPTQEARPVTPATGGRPAGARGRILALREEGYLSKQQFLGEIKRVVDPAALRDAVVALAAASGDVKLQEYVKGAGAVHVPSESGRLTRGA